MEDIYPEKINCLLNKRGKIYNYIKENWYRDPPLTSEDIQKEFNIAPNTVSEYLTDLESRGLIKRKKIGKIKYITPSDFSNLFL